MYILTEQHDRTWLITSMDGEFSRSVDATEGARLATTLRTATINRYVDGVLTNVNMGSLEML